MQSILDAATLVPSKVDDRIDTEVHHKGNGYASLADIIEYAIVPSMERIDAIAYSIQGISERQRLKREAQKKMQEHATRHVISHMELAEPAAEAEGGASWLEELFGETVLQALKTVGMFGMRLVGGFLFDALAWIAENVVMTAGRAFVSWIIEPALLAATAVFANPIGLAALAAIGGIGIGWWLLNKLLGKGANGPALAEAHETAINATPAEVAAVPSSTFDNFTPSGAAYPRPRAQPEVTNQVPAPVPYTGGSSSLENAARAALKSEQTWGVPALVSLAQFNLESGGGKHMPQGSNNPFGIKARAGQPFVEAMTWEHINGKDIRIPQKFRKFSSLDEAFDEHAKLLATARPYAKARQYLKDPVAYSNALTGVYATDPNYGTKLQGMFPKLSGILSKVANPDATVSVQTGQQVSDRAIAATQPTPAAPPVPVNNAAAGPSASASARSRNKTVIRGPGKTLVAVN